MIIFYHEDKSTENAVKHFKAAEMQQIGCVFSPPPNLILGLSQTKY